MRMRQLVLDSTSRAPLPPLAVQTSLVRNSTHTCPRDSASPREQAALPREEGGLLLEQEVRPEAAAPQEEQAHLRPEARPRLEEARLRPEEAHQRQEAALRGPLLVLRSISRVDSLAVQISRATRPLLPIVALACPRILVRGSISRVEVMESLDYLEVEPDRFPAVQT